MMRNIRYSPVFLLLCAFCLTGISGEPVGGELVMEHSLRVEILADGQTETQGFPDPSELVPNIEGPHITLGKAAEWLINNSVKANGWSFTGWSKTGLDENYKPWRLHIGIISGELDVNVAYDLSDKENRTPSYALMEEWEHRRSNEVVFGIVFTKSF